MASTAPAPGSPASAFPSPAPSAPHTCPPPPPDTPDTSPPPPPDTPDTSPPPPPDTPDTSPPPPPDTPYQSSSPSPLQPVALAPSPVPPLAESPEISTPPSSVYHPALPRPISSSPKSSVSPPHPAAAENSSSAGSGGGLSTALVATIGAVAGLLVLGLIVIVLFLKMRKKKVAQLSDVCAMPPSRGSSRETGGVSYGSDFVSMSPEPGGVLGNSRPWFTYEELSKATDGFPAQNLLGQGGFGSVYKGKLVDGREVAAKQLKVGGGQGEREFRAEVEIISRIHHRHLVSLVGYCISESRRLLVYDYVPNKTLYFHLHGKGREEVMDWATRLKVAAGAAHGIAYLHEDCRPRVIHRDIKSSNILLDNNFEARVSDFGLAKLDFDANTHISTRVMGTFGYMAPEYAASGQLTEKSDVYSLGVVLLELITGREPVDTSQPLAHKSLVEWARPSLSHVLENNEFHILVDSRLEQNYDQSQMIQMIEVAAACVRHSAMKRPRMGQVVRALDSITDADYQWNKVGRKRNML